MGQIRGVFGFGRGTLGPRHVGPLLDPGNPGYVPGIIPSRAGMIRLEGGITPSEGGRMLCGRRDASIGTFSPEGGNISSEGGIMPPEGDTAAYFQIQQFSLVGGIFHS